MRNTDLDRAFKQQLQKDAESLWKSKVEIKQLLHPNLSQSELMPELEQDLRRESAPSQGMLLSQIKQRAAMVANIKTLRNMSGDLAQGNAGGSGPLASGVQSQNGGGSVIMT
jgi:hypothetical protein